jgi:uncharacterized membrane protein
MWDRPVQVSRIPTVEKHRKKAMMSCDWLGLRLPWIIMSRVERYRLTRTRPWTSSQVSTKQSVTCHFQRAERTRLALSGWAGRISTILLVFS